ncbi:MAG: ABC transporter permease subunit, partial [Acutalibacter sp.]|nr:ABC transporter permease subunit [Acutalibacter sp.]
KNLSLYLLLLPGVVYLIIFKYIPIGVLVMAFQDFNIFAGFFGSEWVGLAQFRKLFASPDFYRIFRNTLLVNTYKIVFVFPLPVMLAIMLNEIRCTPLKKVSQTVVYLPHFLSWIIVSGLFMNILSPSGGMVNQIITALGGEPVFFMSDNRWFRTVLVVTDAWKEMGWSAIVYIAAIAGVEQELYEAATVDGAGKLRQIWHVTLPGIVSTIVLMFILKLGSIMSGGFDQVLTMYNASVYETGDIIQTYVYRIGLGKMQYSFSSAVGMFNSVIGLALTVAGNTVSKRLTGRSIW